MAKIYKLQGGDRTLWLFNCPGCKRPHPFDERWKFNGDLEKPTFSPSLLCNQHVPGNRCHSWVTDGKIKFLDDCFHELKGQTVEIPEWDGWQDDSNCQ